MFAEPSITQQVSPTQESYLSDLSEGSARFTSQLHVPISNEQSDVGFDRARFGRMETNVPYARGNLLAPQPLTPPFVEPNGSFDASDRMGEQIPNLQPSVVLGADNSGFTLGQPDLGWFGIDNKNVPANNISSALKHVTSPEYPSFRVNIGAFGSTEVYQGVTDESLPSYVHSWFDLSGAPSVVSQATRHPCREGKDCECGGGCSKSPKVGAFKESRATNPYLNNAFTISNSANGKIEAAFKEAAQYPSEDPNRDILKGLDSTKPGNSITLICEYGNGLRELLQASVQNDLSVQVRITDTVRARTLVDLTYDRKGEFWAIGERLFDIRKARSIAQFALGAWSALYVARTRAAHNFQESQEDRLGLNSPQDDPPDGPVCINHDLVCSFPNIPIPELGFTGPKLGGLEPDNKTLIFFGMPCIGFVQVDISECCFEHDVAYWCSQNSDQKEDADATVSRCIADKLLHGILDAYNNFWALLCMGFITILDPFITIGTIFDFAAVYAETYALIYASLQVGSPFNESEKYDAAGKHAKSCLCGGNAPTVPCDWAGQDKPNYPGGKACRDLCSERGKHEDCQYCGWYCKNGQKVFGSEEGLDLPCCPESTRECTKDFTGPECCYRCGWKCGDNPPGWFFDSDRSGKLPCCLPAERQPALGDQCHGQRFDNMPHKGGK